MSETTQQPTQQLPGYRLIEKIGVGGYGEVWSAEAPGGLMKAIKYVFGDQLEKRATDEMHALEKVKEVRHPFLLSLERIEVIEGRLLIVTELADGSLRDRFRECIEQGLSGIPREELLGYLRDAADSLDFLSSKHDLAHLDIKPENLLLVAGHVKVADYGLVKNISNQTQASLVGGMTPAYAAPEVFRGVPTRQSDQYSLAILYQELLTGGLPFSGENAAELTLQHLNHDPDLSRLSEGDRFAISRALSKDSEHRYESSVAFVTSLMSSSGAGTTFSPTATTTADLPRPTQIVNEEIVRRHGATEVFSAEGSQIKADTKPLLMSIESLDHPDAVETVLPQIVESKEPFTPTPALFIGIGNTAGKVLRAVRKLSNEQLGVQGQVATMPMLLLDTDSQSLASAVRGNDSSGRLEANETLSLPLRKPQQYREKADTILRWLGRRWLYNIPRSLTTEGIRPLGRLALVDHARRTFQRIRGAVTDALSEQARVEALGKTGIKFQDSGLRVYIVASVSGGTGSGMTLDIAYGVRSLLERMGVRNASITGVITHSTFRDTSRAELARVNTYAWLSELNQFSSSSTGYPGDEGCGLPAHPAGVHAFDNTYFVPLGEQLDNTAYELATDSMAEYLVADSLTPLQVALDASREEGGRNKENTLQSFAVTRSGTSEDEALSKGEIEVIRHMLEGWKNNERAEFSNKITSEDRSNEQSTDHVLHGVVSFIAKTQLDATTLASSCRTRLEASLGGDAGAFIDSRLGDIDSTDPAKLIATVDRVFLGNHGDVQTVIEGEPLSDRVQSLSEELHSELADWVLGHVNDPNERLSGASLAAAWAADHLTGMQKDLIRLSDVLANEVRCCVEGTKATIENDEDCPNYEKYFRLRLDQAALSAAQGIAQSLLKSAKAFPKEIEVLDGLLTELTDYFVLPDEETKESSFEISDSERQQLVVALETRLQEDYLDSNQGLLGSLSTDESAQEFKRTLEHVVRHIVAEVLPTLESRSASDSKQHTVFSKPSLCQFGGTYRHMALVNTAKENPDKVIERLQGVVSIPDFSEECLLVTESQGASLSHVAADLIRSRRDYAAFAERTRTRRDIPWVDPVEGNDAVVVNPVSVKQSEHFSSATLA